MFPPACALITPARNEAQFIELTIESIVKQTVRPMKWVIVSDGSTDGTDELVRKHAALHSWIELVHMPERVNRNFAGKVYAFNAGYQRLSETPYEVVGNLDGDVSFQSDYLETILHKFADNPRLGVASTVYVEGTTKVDYRFSLDQVSGACQLFRRECFTEIGGYAPLKGGNIDSIAVLAARAKGWQTRTFDDRFFVHHRFGGTAQVSALKARFRRGEKAYEIGSHPAWELFRTAYQITKPPYLVGGLMMFSGYLWANLQHKERVLSPELMAFNRREQLGKLNKILKGRGRVVAGQQ
jgi:poly-beta-1,6-N-acetyl-D-glucosamine synthase